MHRPVHLHIKMLFSESETRHFSFTSSRADKRQHGHITPSDGPTTRTVLCTHARTHSLVHTQSKVNISMATHPIEFLGTNVQSYKSTWIYTSTCSLKSFHTHTHTLTSHPSPLACPQTGQQEKLKERT